MSAPSQATQRFAYPWAGRHPLIATILASAVPAVGAMVAGIKLDGMSVVTAFKQLGFPIGCSVALACALIWVFLVYLPKRDAEHAATRQILVDQNAEDRAVFREAIDVYRNESAENRLRLDGIEKKLDMFLQRNDKPRDRKITAPVRTTGPIERVSTAVRADR